MKKVCMIGLTALMALIAQPALAGSVGHDLTPKHGGVVATVKDIDYELVAKPDALTLHVRDHGKALDVSKAAAKVTLLNAGKKSEAELKPTGETLQAAGAFDVAKGTKAVAVVTVPGKSPVTARFVIK